jgi:hypothetical protein
MVVQPRVEGFGAASPFHREEHNVSSISTEIFGRLAGSSTAASILAGKPKDGTKSADATGDSNPLVALLSSGPEEDDDDHTYDASGRSSGIVRMSAASAAGIQDLGDEGWFGDENGNPLPVKLVVKMGDKVVARVYEGGGTIVANGFDPSALKIGPLSEGLESTMTEDELTDFRMAQVMKFFSNMGATFEASSGGRDKGVGDTRSGILTSARSGRAEDEEAASGDEAGNASERTIIPQGMTLAEVLALSNQDYITALEREKRRAAETPPEEQGSARLAQAADAGEDRWFATQQSKAGEALAILQETHS